MAIVGPLKPENTNKAFFVTIPHSGEEIPDEAQWLKNLDEVVLMGDVDRYVDRLYETHLNNLKIPFVKTQWHRYAADLNRLASDVDCEAVLGNTHSAGTFPRGFHWVYNTLNEKILKAPLSIDVHNALVKKVYDPFHERVKDFYLRYEAMGFKNIYHCDLHSMPSVGTSQHRDPGEKRADVVISDSHGKSCNKDFLDLVVACFEKEKFKVSYNWPYFGGRLTEQYGQPTKGHHVVQIELNRSLYMNETTKQWDVVKGPQLSLKLEKVLHELLAQIKVS
jgi:N-formylglutamate amidohydrolase